MRRLPASAPPAFSLDPTGMARCRDGCGHPRERYGLEMAGVRPHPLPWPADDRLDPQLLADGDTRNVADRYRYWKHDSIVADLDARRLPFHVAVENWEHDFNIGAVVRNANAFGAGAVHIVGRRRWNRRGAMVTDRYQHIHHHTDIASLAEWASEHSLPLIGIDNIEGSVPLETFTLPNACVLVFGQEGPGLSAEARRLVEACCSISMVGSTRSINAGVASGIAMYSWHLTHRPLGGLVQPSPHEDAGEVPSELG